jgi:hypothetical protein
MADDPNMVFKCASCGHSFVATPDAFVECGITLGAGETPKDVGKVVEISNVELAAMSVDELTAIRLTPEARDQILALDPEKQTGPVHITTGAEPICPACQEALFGNGPRICTDPGELSDGYHTFNELYEHRHTLFLALMKAHPDKSWLSTKHHDGSEWDGWFIGGMDLPAGPITYHLPIRLWYMATKTGAEVLERGKEWDGHTSGQVVVRLQCFVHQKDEPDV